MKFSSIFVFLAIAVWVTLVKQASCKVKFFFAISEVRTTGNKIQGGACCQGVIGSHCTTLCKPVLTICLKNSSHTCVDSMTTTIDMKRDDVILGSRIGNATNPVFLEVESWKKYLDKISVRVVDIQNSSSPLIYQTEFSDYNLQIGDNILSQHWRQQPLKANDFSDRNAFFIQITYKAYCSEGYYGSDCTDHCPGNPQKCVVNGHTYCKMGWHGINCDEDVNECASRYFCGHGTCTNTAGSFHCKCPSSVYGLKCQLDEDECLLEPCNGGQCVNKIGSYSCQCKNGTTGKNCESLTAHQCHSDTCYNYGQCHEVIVNIIIALVTRVKIMVPVKVEEQTMHAFVLVVIWDVIVKYEITALDTAAVDMELVKMEDMVTLVNVGLSTLELIVKHVIIATDRGVAVMGHVTMDTVDTFVPAKLIIEEIIVN
ncbi:protein serrate-like [Saccostrea echinata]|uniref:protein serrate-like n=1 Tax=Saccostrea echinata TaxID=191078 RepID=UPI002A7EC737|nr:protein serrate-like [Saccostrea echinata]